jgi:hypothetical protein
VEYRRREPPPWFRWRQQWYGLHLIKGEHAAKQMAYDTQLDWINKMFIGANVTSLKKTLLRTPASWAWRMSWRCGLGTQVVFLYLATPSSFFLL